MEEGTFELYLDRQVGFRYVRTRGEHSRRKPSNEQRHRGGINPGRSREVSRLRGRQREEEKEEGAGKLGKGFGTRSQPWRPTRAWQTE